MCAFIVQECVHADRLSAHGTEREAVGAIQGLIREGAAAPGELNVREIDGSGRTIRVFTPDLSVRSKAA